MLAQTDVEVKMAQIQTPVAPNLPLSPTVYSEQHFDIFNNVLRLYFNQVSSSIRELTVPSAGATTERPINRIQLGQMYFDTTLGIPIWWDGTNWVDATGTTV
jgi:hypothetical protein